MKVEIKTNDKGICEYFKIDGKKYGNCIYELNIKINPYELPEILIKAKTNEQMDAVGEKKAIEANAVVMLRKEK